MAFSFAELGSSILLFCLVFGMSATVEISSLQKQIRNRTALLIGVCLQFLILPAVGFLVVKIFSLPSEIGVILLVITSSPGGSYSNWWCSLFNAELALSVTMTTLSTLLSVVMLPLNLLLYARWDYNPDVVKSLDWTALVVSLVVVMGGIGSGLLASWHSERQHTQHLFHLRANRMGNIAGILLITLSLTVSSLGSSSSDGGGGAAIWDQDLKFYVALAIPPCVGLGCAIFAATKCQLEPPERVAVAVESCYQNTGIATSVAITLYSGTDGLATAIGVPLYYGLVEAVLLACFCLVAWKFLGWTKAPSNENVCVMLYNSYEVHDEEDKEPELSIEVVLDNSTFNRQDNHDGNDNGGTTGSDLIFAQTEQGGAYIVDESSLPQMQRHNEGKMTSSSTAEPQHSKLYAPPPPPPATGNGGSSTRTMQTAEEGGEDYDDVNLHEESSASSSLPQTPPLAEQHEGNQRRGRRRRDETTNKYCYGEAPAASVGSPSSPSSSPPQAAETRPRLHSANEVVASENTSPSTRPRTSSADDAEEDPSENSEASESSATNNNTAADRLGIAMSVIRARATGYRHATEDDTGRRNRAPPSVLNDSTPVVAVGRSID